MSGFPNLPTRSAFGPEMKNVRPPRNPDRDLTADQMNLAFWQMAGAGRTLPAAVILYDGVNDIILSQALAFDPKQELDNIVTDKIATGRYDFTFASTYKDQRGVDVSFTPSFVFAHVQNGTLNDVINTPFIIAQDVRMNYRNAAGAFADGTFMLQVWG